MKDVMASLPEVIKEYKGYNLLIPTATDVQLNPFYKFHVEEVAVDLSETSGDIFKVGSVDTGRKDDKGNKIYADALPNTWKHIDCRRTMDKRRNFFLRINRRAVLPALSTA